MWIRMRTTAAGAKLPHPLHADTVYQIEDELAERLIAAGAAEKTSAPKSAKRKATDETAAEDVAASETATVKEPGEKALFSKLTDKKK